jgi:hypothetical protein
MDEFLKIAPNGQWTLEKSTSRAYGVGTASPIGTEQATPSITPAPRVSLYRGLNGVTAKDLQKFGVEQFNPAGGIHHATKQTKLKDQGWWSDNPNMGMIYSAYDHVNKKPSKEPTYDVFMVGSAEHPGGTRNITHELRAKNTPISTHRIVYLPTQGTSTEREQNLKTLLPDVKWPVPKSNPQLKR